MPFEIETVKVFTPDLGAFVDTFAFYQAHGTLPEAGGLNDQPATWVDAAHRLMRRIAANQKEDEDREANRRKRAERRARLQGLTRGK